MTPVKFFARKIALLVFLVSPFPPTRGMEMASSEEYMMSVKSPNITILDVSNRSCRRFGYLRHSNFLHQDNVVICMAYDMRTTSHDSDFIGEFMF